MPRIEQQILFEIVWDRSYWKKLDKILVEVLINQFFMEQI